MTLFYYSKIKKIIKNYIKKRIYNAFIFIYGAINSSVDAKLLNNVKIEKVIKENITYNIYLVKNGRLYTNRVDDTAIIIKNEIIEGPSYQLRPFRPNRNGARDNSNISKNIVFEKGTPRIKKKIKGSVLSLLSGGGANNNYFHWLYDVLPRIGLVEILKKEINLDYYLLPALQEQYHFESLNLLNIQKKQLLPSKIFRHIETQKLLVTDHPYNLNNDSYNDSKRIPKWISEWLRNKFLQNSSSEKKFKKIFIDRRDVDPKNSSKRKIKNEEILKKLLSNEGFHFVKFSDIPFSEKIKIFNNAEVILGLHGAGFANICFCKPNTKIIELRSPGTGKIFENIGLDNNLNYHPFECNIENSDDPVNAELEAPIEEIKKII